MRAEWFAGLTKTQKTAVVVTLKDRGFSSMVISQELAIPQSEILRTWSKHADDLGAQVVGLRLTTIAGQLQLMAERAQDGLSKQEKWGDYWKVAKEFVKELQGLGIVDRAIHKVEVTHKFDEQKQEEIDKMVEIEQKRRIRKEELKVVAVEVLDPPPPMEEYD